MDEQPLFGDRDGETYDHDQDYVRLNKQQLRAYHAMKDGHWHTLPGLAAEMGDGEASISARLRDFRKAEFGGHIVHRIRGHGGVFFYKLRWNDLQPRP